MAIMKEYIVLGFIGLVMVGVWATTVHDTRVNKPSHDTTMVSIPFRVKDKAGKTIVSDSIRIHLSDGPLITTRKIQNYLAKKFQEISDNERIKFGGFKEFGLDPQRWIVFQGTKMLKLFSPQQALIDNYDRFDKRYHNLPLTIIYFTA